MSCTFICFKFLRDYKEIFLKGIKKLNPLLCNEVGFWGLRIIGNIQIKMC